MADKAQTPQENQVTLDEQINKALANVDDKGKVVFGDEVEPLFKRAVLAEKKARDNQASFTKSRQEIASLKAAKNVLESKITEGAALTAEQVQELEELKLEDLDKWFERKTQYENEAKKGVKTSVAVAIEEAQTKAVQDLTLNERKNVLADFSARTGLKLTDDVMENDIPPRIQQKIGSMPFEEYLMEVAEYLGKGKTVKQTDESLDQTNIGNLAGGEVNKKEKSEIYQII